MKQRYFLAAALSAIFLPLPFALQAQSQISAQTAKKQAAAVHPQPQQQEEGERIFAQNCSRCHNAPEGFSPRISGTIVRHMRVRASLSRHDEQELLRFFNP
jgi:mono/diheme cytochrome c family protein